MRLAQGDLVPTPPVAQRLDRTAELRGTVPNDTAIGGSHSTWPRPALRYVCTVRLPKGCHRLRTGSWCVYWQRRSASGAAQRETGNIDTDFDFKRLVEQTTSLLRDYLTIDTNNPPGDVSKAADWVEAVLGSEGITDKRLGPTPEKANVVTTLGADRSAQGPLIFAHHMDVVPAVREDWSVDPFAGELRDGFIWGRGALAMKGFGVLSLVCALTLKRLGLPLAVG